MTNSRNEEQTKLWNGTAGSAWVDVQAALDQMFEPFANMLADVAAARSPNQVLDVGCGTGGTTLAIARRLGPTASCIGADISEPMIALARVRAERERFPVRFIRADAQVHPFEPSSVDLIVSRFGVMFFDDPVQAFANLRRAASKRAELQVIAWRSAADNPFMTTAERAAAPLLPTLPPRRPDGPGQFAFADDQRVRGILEESGWVGIEIRPLDVECTLAEKDLVQYVTRLGPVGLMLQNADDETRARVIDTVRPAFDPYVHGAEVRLTTACWMIAARA